MAHEVYIYAHMYRKRKQIGKISLLFETKWRVFGIFSKSPVKAALGEYTKGCKKVDTKKSF